MVNNVVFKVRRPDDYTRDSTPPDRKLELDNHASPGSRSDLDFVTGFQFEDLFCVHGQHPNPSSGCSYQDGFCIRCRMMLLQRYRSPPLQHFGSVGEWFIPPISKIGAA